MTGLCIIVADSGRARFFTVKDPGPTDFLTGPSLEERVDLANPESKATGSDMSSSSATRNREGTEGSAHGYQDHRPGHAEEIARRFAYRVVNAADEFVKSNGIHNLVIMAEPHLLGLLRDQASNTLPKGINRLEFAEDLSWHDVSHIEAALIRHGVMHERASGGFHRPRGQEPRSG
jgi:protein required for attachment to host cells